MKGNPRPGVSWPVSLVLAGLTVPPSCLRLSTAVVATVAGLAYPSSKIGATACAVLWRVLPCSLPLGDAAYRTSRCSPQTL